MEYDSMEYAFQAAGNDFHNHALVSRIFLRKMSLEAWSDMRTDIGGRREPDECELHHRQRKREIEEGNRDRISRADITSVTPIDCSAAPALPLEDRRRSSRVPLSLQSLCVRLSRSLRCFSDQPIRRDEGRSPHHEDSINRLMLFLNARILRNGSRGPSAQGRLHFLLFLRRSYLPSTFHASHTLPVPPAPVPHTHTHTLSAEGLPLESDRAVPCEKATMNDSS
ncbi:hypothetical protein ROHU_036936 [Labeo rohita]|uniref:Uncharacterized protein n=1 Tax=Labeo rohita TaxID=84645 RepID=A0A498MGA0_LABRO|nr:hypothetical protein ROHU_036936 [Labeo rohita]